MNKLRISVEDAGEGRFRRTLVWTLGGMLTGALLGLCWGEFLAEEESLVLVVGGGAVLGALAGRLAVRAGLRWWDMVFHLDRS